MTMTTRQVKKILHSTPTVEGAGVNLNRAFGFGKTSDFDPFLLLDDFRSPNPEDYLAGFPWHPHRGIETITYMLDGLVEHGDSMGNKGVIKPGEVQWMTAGSGIIHQEMPKGDKVGKMGGFQLWANLPAKDKMMDPRYREVKSMEIPEVQLAGGGVARVIAGEVNGIKGPVKDIVIDPAYMDVRLPAHASFSHRTVADHTVFCYVYEGYGKFLQEGTALARNGDLVLFEAGDEVVISSVDEPLKFLLISGKPLHEPVAWYGPIVMNSQAELDVAMRELRNDTFIKFKG
jgi:redox-sensitive bicupin YhaK (pirin superfamily)